MHTPFSYQLAVLIGRFQAWHKGHLQLLHTALQQAPYCLVVLGSAQSAPSAKNPWGPQEREAMIRASLSTQENARVRFVAQDDCYDTAVWSKQVQALAHAIVPEDKCIALVGHHKDNSSIYLRAFPDWGWVAGPQTAHANASDIRAALFTFVLQNHATPRPSERTALSFSHPLLPAPSQTWLQQWAGTEDALRLAQEWMLLKKHQAAWASSPYPVNSVTTDVLVQINDQAIEKILLVQRKYAPGAGLWALPGGFLDPNETLWQCMLRELYEETGLHLSDASAHVALRQKAIFDHPERSNKGRVITHAYHLYLGKVSAPAIQASDDAAAAQWLPVADVLQWRRVLHDDHAHVIRHFLAQSSC